MLVLGMETSTPICSVALADSNRIIAEYTLDIGANHSEKLLFMTQALLEGSGLQTSDLDGVAVSAGPGSFTGLRIGMSSAKGLCMASNLPLLTVSSLEGLAWGVVYAGMPICAILDARRRQVYVGFYRMEGGRLVSFGSENATGIEDLLRDIYRPILFVGNGACVYRDLILETLDGDAHFSPKQFNWPRAGSIALLGKDKLVRGEIADLFSAEPNYLKRSKAVEIREEELVPKG